MENLEHKVDRSGWPRGPWNNEEDRYEWRHVGLPCLIVRNRGGALCGYVGVEEGHPYYKEYYADIDQDIRVHGGLTYSDACGGPICHVPKEGESDRVWWLGFDCAHWNDVSPGRSTINKEATYKTVEYVTNEVNRLAEQLKEKA